MKLGRTPVDHVRYAAVPKLEDFADLSDKHLIADATNYRKRMVTAGGALGNLKYGCCTCAAIGHYLQTVCAVVGTTCSITEEMVLQWYHDVTGWTREDPASDNGANMLDVLQYLKARGVIRAYARVDFKDSAKFAAAINLTGGVYLGAGLPIAWQDTDTWTSGPSMGGDWAKYSWGGHAFNQASYGRDTGGDVDTWGEWVQLTKPGRLGYVDEGYAVIFDAWFYGAEKKTIQLLDLDGLTRALARLG